MFGFFEFDLSSMIPTFFMLLFIIFVIMFCVEIITKFDDEDRKK